MADARFAMNQKGTLLVYRSKPRRQNRNCVALSLAPEPHGTKYSGTDDKVTRFLKFATSAQICIREESAESHSSRLNVVIERKPQFPWRVRFLPVAVLVRIT